MRFRKLIYPRLLQGDIWGNGLKKLLRSSLDLLQTVVDNRPIRLSQLKQLGAIRMIQVDS